MPAVSQPAIQNDKGVELTVGFNSLNGDRVAIVQPMVTDAAALSDNNLCYDCVNAFTNILNAQLCPCITSDMYVTFVQGEGMVDGMIPFRNDFTPTDHPGTAPAGSMPSNVTGLITYYEDPRDIAAGKRMRTAHTFMPGVPESYVVGDIITNTLYNAYAQYALQVQNGFPTFAGSSLWYRFLSAPYQITANPTPPPAMIRTRPRGMEVPRVAAVAVRSYVATQRRRMIPH